MLYKHLFPALQLASLAYAGSTVTSMFIFGADEQPLAASIIGNDATATTYSINCTPGTPGDECGMGPGMTLIAGADTTRFIFDDGEAFQYTAACSVKNSRAVCTESAGGSEANFPGVSTTTTDVELMAVTVTAGEVTDAETTASTTGSASSASAGAHATSTSAAASETASETGSESDSASESGSETGSGATPTGAAAQVTGAVGVVVGGALVAFMGALL
ncbi:hypothetical protein BJX99DRAFT_234559 [Aspergillus californicus]